MVSQEIHSLTEKPACDLIMAKPEAKMITQEMESLSLNDKKGIYGPE